MLSGKSMLSTKCLFTGKFSLLLALPQTGNFTCKDVEKKVVNYLYIHHLFSTHYRPGNVPFLPLKSAACCLASMLVVRGDGLSCLALLTQLVARMANC